MRDSICQHRIGSAVVVSAFTNQWKSCAAPVAVVSLAFSSLAKAGTKVLPFLRAQAQKETGPDGDCYSFFCSTRKFGPFGSDPKFWRISEEEGIRQEESVVTVAFKTFLMRVCRGLNASNGARSSPPDGWDAPRTLSLGCGRRRQPPASPFISTGAAPFPRRCSFSQPCRESSCPREMLLADGSKGYLDEQFLQLEELQDDASPNFVEEVVTLFFSDSARLITNIEQALEKNPRDFLRLDGFVHQLKGSSSRMNSSKNAAYWLRKYAFMSIGAVKVKNECSVFREYCNQGNTEGSLKSFQKVKREHTVLRQKLENYFQMLRQVTPVERAVRPN
ncbi:hypothetical protein Taro_018896 [Colocasia esculenta]|uniref:Histidine-containing phosphotransfer protein n=1 Tax=Colocasia esculenta TaxID=4460 RepID=A0A843V3U3_COLES|nr:hypothetical protein [Colocasia esculenta]